MIEKALYCITKEGGRWHVYHWDAQQKERGMRLRDQSEEGFDTADQAHEHIRHIAEGPAHPPLRDGDVRLCL